MTTPSKNPPPILDAVVDVVLRYHPKPVTPHAKKRRRKKNAAKKRGRIVSGVKYVSP